MTALDDFLLNARFLIVDDEPANVRLLEYQLEESGRHNVRSTTDSRKALEIWAEFQPDIILLDLMMPHVSGFDVMAQLREALPEDSFLPIVALTADISVETRRKALAAGARDFLLKPFDVTELELRIRNLLESRFLHLGLQQQNRSLEARVSDRTADLEAALAELRETQRQTIYQERLHAFASMAGGVVHDFNNNLMVLQGFSELLLLPGGLANPDKVRRDVELINRASQNAAQVVDRLRQFYRPRTQDDAYAPVRLKEIADEVFALAGPRWQGQALGLGSEIATVVEVSPALEVHGQASELREALVNLVFNSVDAMPRGGKITIAAQVVGDLVRVTLRDTGIGMTEEVRQRCLEPFFTTKGDRGTGLGLAAVFGILRRHEGNLEIVSAPGYGTTFVMTLPHESADAAARVSQEATTERPSSKRLNVLFVDDDEGVREVIPLYLESYGHQVTVACDGCEALGLYEPGKFDVVLTDLSMPRMNGTALAEAVKKESASQPVVMLTGFGHMLLAGGQKPDAVDLLLSKPITAANLVAALQNITA